MNDQNRVTQEPVIVVGAGPAGCTAALLLADFGIPVTLLERHTQPHPLPRAVHLDDEVARTLDRIGVSEGFLARSRPGSGLRLLDASHRVMAEFSRDHQASRARVPAGQHVPPARPGRAAARPDRAAPADRLPPRSRGDRAGRHPRPGRARARSGCTPASPGKRRRSPARSCWAATAPTARSGSWPGSPWTTSASPNAGSWSISASATAWTPGTALSRSATPPAPPPSCRSPATGTAGSSGCATARTKPA